ncbi:MAG: hypothetical protein ACRC1H_11375, partial [Caldilineaceae bacterium]
RVTRLTPLQAAIEEVAVLVAQLRRDGVRVLGVQVDADDDSSPTVRISADDAERLDMSATYYAEVGAEHVLGVERGNALVIWSIPRVEPIN